MLTLRELKHAVENAAFTDRVPTYRALRESGSPIVAKEMVDAQSRIDVYQNGFVAYRVGRHSTVFPLHACCAYVYEFNQKDHFHFEDDFFENKNWYFRVMLEGEDRIAKNEDWCNERKCISYSAVAEDWSEMAQEDMMLHELICQEEVEKLLSFSTEKQRMVMKKYYMEQMQEDEIAEELGVTQQAVSDMLRKGIRRVRRKVG
ncbi:sigma-70 family RNA polymerase sigma factor [bacterium 1XD42-54]|nr:sigma-70 family RNA polymerase sigma factor [bacterium 1XD42-54]